MKQMSCKLHPRWSHEYQEATIEKILRFLGKPSQDQLDRGKEPEAPKKE